jgi:hypothetical protein
MSDPLRWGVLLCAAWAALALGAQFLRTRAFGRRRWISSEAAPTWKGVAYGFGPGLWPTAKESVRQHLPIYLIGVAYHAGVFAGLALLALAVAGAPPGGPSLAALGALSLVGAAAGAVLLVRRLRSGPLRAISCPDDYLANGLTTLFAALAGARALTPAAQAGLAAVAMGLFLYVPVGKIRHCVFFFSTRYHSGAFFGRRGVLPPAA